MTHKKKNRLTALFLRKRRKDESLFKYLMAVFHLWFGLLSSVVICILCITGCIYAFKNQITDLYNYDKVFIKGDSTPIDFDEIQKHFTTQNKTFNTLFIPKSESRSWIISYTDAQQKVHSTYFNPYQKQELGIGNDDLDNFFQTTLQLHRNLLLGDVGRQIVGAFALIFVLMLVSGFVIWLPKKWKLLRQHLSIKLKAKPQRVNYDLHRALGFYALLPLIFIAITGLYVTYPWVKNGLIVSLGGKSLSEINISAPAQNQEDDFSKLMEEMLSRQNEKTENMDNQGLTLKQILHQTNKHLPYEGDMVINFPNTENPRYIITKINSENWLRALLPDEISLDKKGELKTKNLFADKPLHQQFTALAKPLHTGEIMGLPSIILYFIVSLIGFMLPITGFMIWWNKAKKL